VEQVVDIQVMLKLLEALQLDMVQAEAEADQKEVFLIHIAVHLAALDHLA
jgi:hypothetical protein